MMMLLWAIERVQWETWPAHFPKRKRSVSDWADRSAPASAVFVPWFCFFAHWAIACYHCRYNVMWLRYSADSSWCLCLLSALESYYCCPFIAFAVWKCRRERKELTAPFQHGPSYPMIGNCLGHLIEGEYTFDTLRSGLFIIVMSSVAAFAFVIYTRWFPSHICYLSLNSTVLRHPHHLHLLTMQKTSS